MPLAKAQRQERIARIVSERRVHSQQELQELLGAAGAAVTQATLSRDLQDLGVLKGPEGYILRQGAQAPPPAGTDTAAATLRRSLRREMRSIDHSGNLVVLRTDAGHANALAVEMDRASLPEILGTLAGDDTIISIVRRGRSAAGLVKRLKEMAS